MQHRFSYDYYQFDFYIRVPFFPTRIFSFYIDLDKAIFDYINLGSPRMVTPFVKIPPSITLPSVIIYFSTFTANPPMQAQVDVWSFSACILYIEYRSCEIDRNPVNKSLYSILTVLLHCPLCINRGSKWTSRSDETQYGSWVGVHHSNYYDDKKSKIDRGPKKKIAIFDFPDFILLL